MRATLLTLARLLPPCFAILACVLAMNASANGGFWDTSHRAAGNLVTPSSRFKLHAETLDIRLHALDYEVTVTYSLVDTSAGVKGRQTQMYFPLICTRAESGAAPAPDCMKQMTVRADGRVLATQLVKAGDPGMHKVLAPLAEKLTARALKTLGINPEYDEAGSQYQYFRFTLPAERSLHSLEIRYRAEYYQLAEGTSKSVGTGYSRASLVYDFLPAAAWAGRNIDRLDIRLDASGLQGPLWFDAGQWPFVMQGNVGRFSIQHPDFTSLPPLILASSNGNYRNFLDLVQDLKAGEGHYRATVVSATPSAHGFTDISAVTDRNPDTYWCWQGEQAILRISADEGLIGQSENTLYFKQLWGFGLLPGARPDAAMTMPPGIPASLEIQPATGDPVRFPLEAIAPQSDRDRFASFTLLQGGLAAGLPANLPEPGSITLEDRQRLQQQEYVFRIQRATSGLSSDETCIAEILPAYNY